jgi:hypothetical protein
LGMYPLRYIRSTHETSKLTWSLIISSTVGITNSFAKRDWVLLSFQWMSEGGYLILGGLNNRAALQPMDAAAPAENAEAKVEA